jgi:hypothetical protein
MPAETQQRAVSDLIYFGPGHFYWNCGFCFTPLSSFCSSLRPISGMVSDAWGMVLHSPQRPELLTCGLQIITSLPLGGPQAANAEQGGRMCGHTIFCIFCAGSAVRRR